MPNARAVVRPLGLLVVGLGLSGVPAHAQFRQPKAELTPAVQQRAVQPGQTVTLSLGVELPEDIHVQSDQPRDPFVIPTVLTFTPPEGVSVEEIIYPASTEFLLEGWDEPLDVFDHEFAIEVRLLLGVDVPPGELVVLGSLLYQSCDDKVCFPPANAPVEWRLLVEPANNHQRPTEGPHETPQPVEDIAPGDLSGHAIDGARPVTEPRIGNERSGLGRGSRQGQDPPRGQTRR